MEDDYLRLMKTYMTSFEIDNEASEAVVAR
jgi:hypothetical protein